MDFSQHDLMSQASFYPDTVERMWMLCGACLENRRF